MALPSSQPVTWLTCEGMGQVSRGRVVEAGKGGPGPGGCLRVGGGRLSPPTPADPEPRAPPAWDPAPAPPPA